MNRRFFFVFICCYLFAVSFKAVAQEKDTLFLRNGQIMIGKLNSISLGIIQFDDMDLAVQNVKYHKIKTIKAGMATYRIQTIDQAVYYGVLKPSKNYGEVIVDDGVVTKPYPIVNIFNLVSLEKKFIKKIKGTIAYGYSYTKSSDIGRTNIDWNLNFTEQKYQVEFVGSFIYTNNQSVKTRDRESVGLGGYYNLNTVLVAGLGLNYQRNIELGLASRIQQVVGFGRRFLFRPNLQGTLISGFVINQERSLEGNSSGSLYEIPLQFKLDYFHYAAPNLSFTVFPKAFFGLKQDGRKRFDGETRVNWEVIRNLDLGLQFYASYDNQALAGSTTNFDYGIVFNVGYKFK
ncbi:DUF481 domain-containing protein [Cognataquiflexum rubidum]|uniref:DUF481 domain-containing protein n=1 Tax=Cognataquiflexum rubidum TaxID=2922273 RepID=UPI001F13567D|nr:DUF481 domain-containing protein [Cognataquiflexum rubidum]MCH6233223.1 DUF481 domain-containing protein [Cognataquiflexum rubidum]